MQLPIVKINLGTANPGIEIDLSEPLCLTMPAKAITNFFCPALMHGDCHFSQVDIP